MIEMLHFSSYGPKDLEKLRLSIDIQIKISWLQQHKGLILQICDELLKNAFKSNYRFLLLWRRLLKQLLQENLDMSMEAANAWLKKAFYSQENVTMERLIKQMPNPEKLDKQVGMLLQLESNMPHTHKNNPRKTHGSDFETLLEVKRFAKEIKIYVDLTIERTEKKIIITVINQSPILKEDFRRIQNIREKFKGYYEAGRPEHFFFDNIDTSRSGHGLGYALMDSILLQMGLLPHEALHLVSSENTKVILALPVEQPSKINL